MSRSRKPGAKAYSSDWKRRVAEGTARARARNRAAARIGLGDLNRWRVLGQVSPALLPVVKQAQEEAWDIGLALGGPDELSPQRRALLADLARLGVALGGLTAVYLRNEDPETASRMATLANARRQHLLALGLDERRVEQDLDAYLAARAAGVEEPHQDAPDGAQETNADE